MVDQQLEAEEKRRRGAMEQACKNVLDQLAQKAGFARCNVLEGSIQSTTSSTTRVYTLELDTASTTCLCPVVCWREHGDFDYVLVTTEEDPERFKQHCYTTMLAKCIELLRHNSSDGISSKLVALAYSPTAGEPSLCESIEQLELLASLAGLDSVQQL